MRALIKLCLLCLVSCFAIGLDAQCSQLLTEISDPDCLASCSVCLGDEITFTLTGDNMQDGGCIDWYLGPNGTGDLTGETYVGCSDITTDCAGGPQAMFVMIDPGGGGERCDEFIVLHTGDSGFNGSDIDVTNEFGNPIGPYTIGNTSVFTPDCGLIPVGPGDFIPDDALLIIQTSAIGTVNFDITELCNLGLDIYVLASTNTSCGGGFFQNDAGHQYTVTLGCDSDVVMYPTGNTDAWSYQDGEINSGLNVPEMDIPDPSPGLTTIADFTLEITQDIIDDLCTPQSVQLDLQGYLNPQDGGGCPDVETATYNLILTCPEITDIDDIDACENAGVVSIDLTIYDDQISGGSGDVVWYNNSGGTNEITDPNNYIGTGPVYASVEVNGCESDLIEILINVFPEPMIDLFIDPDPACAGEDIMLFEDGGDAISWDWSGPGFTSDDQNPTVNNAQAGTYIVTVEDANGCMATGSIDFVPLPGPEATVDVSNTTLCEGDCIDITFTVSNGGGGPYDLEWNFAGLITIPFTAVTENTTWTICTTPGLLPIIDDVNNIAFIPDFLSTFSLELISISEAGCMGTVDADVIQFDIVEPPTANNAGPLETCLEAGMTEASFDLFSLEATIGGGQDVEWYEDMDLTDQIFPPFMTDVSTTVYAVVFDGECYSEPVAIDLIILTAGGAGDDGSLTFCQNETAMQDLFAALNGTPDLGGIWTDVDGSGVDITNPNMVDFSTVTPGTYNYTYSFEAVGSCPASSANVEVTINALPQIFFGTDGCTPDNMFYVLSFSIDVTGNVFSDIGVLTNITGNEYEISVPIEESSFTIMVTNPNTGCMYAETFVVPDCDCGSIQDPAVDAEISICEGSAFPIIDPNLPAGLEAQWFDGSGNLIQTSNTFQPTAPGLYSVQFVDTDDPSCISQSISFTIVVELPANIGMNASEEICAGNTSLFNLIDLLGNPDAGGIWIDQQMTGINLAMPTSITFETLPIGQYTYTYMIESEACGDQAVAFTLNIVEPPNAGTDKDTLFCTGFDELINLENIIAPFDVGGVWSEVTGTIDLTTPNSVDITNTMVGTYTITYSFAGTGFCAEQIATINLTIVDKPSAGDDVITNVCIGADIDLTTLLISNNSIGTFESIDPSIILNGFLFETAGLALASYEFYHILEETQACEADTALITVVLNNSLVAGDDNTVEVCPESGIQLINYIMNGDLGGTFTNLSNSMLVDMGIFDATGLEGQSFSFEYQVGGGSCPIDIALLTLNILDEPSVAITIDTETICLGECAALQVTIPSHNGDAILFYQILDETGTVVLNDQFNMGSATVFDQQVCNIEDNTVLLSNLEPDQNYSIQFLSIEIDGCPFDLFDIITINSTSPEPVFIEDTLCENLTVVVGNETFDVNNPMGSVTLSSVAGCDSTINVDLDFLPLASGEFTETLCGTAIVTINGTQYSVTNPVGFENFLGGAANGCDSLLTIDLTFEDEVILEVNESLCEGDFIEIGGTIFDSNNPSGQAIGMSSTPFGCDTTFNVMLDFDGAFVFDALELCPGDDMGIIVIEGEGTDLLPANILINGMDMQTATSLPYELNLPLGSYSIEVVGASGCVSTDIINLINNIDPQFNITQSNIGGNVYQLDVNANVQIDSVIWSSEAVLSCENCLTLTTSQIDGSQTFNATAYYGNGCTLTDSLMLTEDLSDCIFMANIFSPDGDGFNDELYVQTCETFNIEGFYIYDRWGNLMWFAENYMSNEISQSWDGRTSNSQRVTPGVYVYKVIADVPGIGEQILSGSVTIMR